MTPYRAGGNARDALWLPGVIAVVGGRVHVGAEVGWTPPRAVDAWNRTLAFVPRAAIGHDAARLGVNLPWEGLGAGHRFVGRASTAASLVAVTESARAGLVGAGLRVTTISWDRDARTLLLGAEGGSAPPIEIAGDLARLPVVEGEGPPTVDRILRAISGGTMTEAAVTLAAELNDAVIAGQDALGRWETWLDDAFRRAGPVTPEAFAVAEAVAGGASGEADELVPIPYYGSARRCVSPALVIASAEDAASTWTLPAETVHDVADVARWDFADWTLPASPPRARPRDRRRGGTEDPVAMFLQGLAWLRRRFP